MSWFNITKYFAASLFVLSLAETRAWSCASCGSGGDDPLILYPNEWLKVFLGLSQISHFKNVDPDGSTSTAGGPEVKQNMTTAVGYGFSPRSFTTLTLPYMRNVLGDRAQTSFGDPSIAGRYSVILQSIDEPMIPQVQVLVGYKHAVARSLRESKELKTLLDVFGTGFSEMKLGIDIWFGITRLKPGVSHSYSLPLKRSFDGLTYEPGLVSRTTISLGYNWLDQWKMTAGINRDQRRALKIDGIEQKNSAQLNHSVFLTSDFMLTSEDSVRASVSRQAALANNYSTSMSDTVAAAYMHTF